MTKYTDNEQYEKDKAKLIEYCESPMAKLGYHSQQRIGEIAKLLNEIVLWNFAEYNFS